MYNINFLKGLLAEKGALVTFLKNSLLTDMASQPVFTLCLKNV